MITGFAEASVFLQERLPFFQNSGASAYRPGLNKIRALLQALGNPQEAFRSIHIGGTNGKGSSAHMAAAILQSAGYRTGLFTSPHLKSVTERFRIDGVPMSEQLFTEWVNRLIPLLDELEPTYFEATVALAFGFFRDLKVDVAVVEVGLGGRLDATNVIHPLACLITNIGHDHLEILGPGLEDVAREKAGIIKNEVPVIIGERQSGIDVVFQRTASILQAPLVFAEDLVEIKQEMPLGWMSARVGGRTVQLNPDLKGSYQVKNIRSVMALSEILNTCGLTISDTEISKGIAHTTLLTGLKGRWQQLATGPLVICDTAHNPEGIAWVAAQARAYTARKIRWVIGVVADKDTRKLLHQLPKEAYFYFCQASSPRALNAERLAVLAGEAGLQGCVVPDVNQAVEKAINESAPDDLVLICGSNYIVAELRNL